MKFVMHTPHIILDVLTKWHNQILPIFVVILFLSSVMLEF
jgi:hypothetical protein